MAKTRLTTKIGESWRIWAAFVYLGICIFDYGFMPWIIEQSNKRLSITQAVSESLKYPEESQATVLTQLQTPRVWEPLTAAGGGLFHVSFGAILGATAFNKYREQQEQKPAPMDPPGPQDESDEAVG